MIKKENLWFLTLFSLVLVLALYYITMPSELFFNANEEVTSIDKTESVSSIEEADLLSVMRVELNDEREELIDVYQKTLNNTSATSQEKNEAYEQIKYINELKGIESNLESVLKNKLDVNSFVKVEDDQVMVVVVKDKHDVSLANSIMREVQSEFDDKMYISVKFEKQ